MSKVTVSKDKTNPYLIMNKTGLQDKRLSRKAKGILAYLLSLPDDRQIHISELITHSKDGRDGTLGGIKELVLFGYITKKQVKGEGGKFDYCDYTIYEKPIRETSAGKPSTDLPSTENPLLLSNDGTDTISPNGESDIEEQKSPNGENANASNERQAYGNQEIKRIIQVMKEGCEEAGIQYMDGYKPTRGAKNILSNKLAKEIEKYDMPLEMFIKNIIKLSSQPFMKACNSPSDFYKNWGYVLNSSKKAQDSGIKVYDLN